jgi:hypothetical protein
VRRPRRWPWRISDFFSCGEKSKEIRKKKDSTWEILFDWFLSHCREAP